jgi:Ca2+/Na+ antiporter
MSAMENTAFRTAYRWALLVLLGFLLVRNFIFDYHNAVWAAVDGGVVLIAVVVYLFKSKWPSNS